MRIFRYYTIAVIMLYMASFQFLWAEEGSGNWMTMEYQFDTRDFNVLDITGFASLPHGFSIWGFIDLEGEKGSFKREYDFATYFTEIDLMSPTWRNIGLIAELDSITGSDNDIGRFGLNYVTNLNPKGIDLTLIFHWYLFETDGRGNQTVIAWDAKLSELAGGRFSINGFMDTNFRSGDDLGTYIVSESQFRFRLVEGLHFLLEVKHNDFLPPGEKTGVGIGLQYHF